MDWAEERTEKLLASLRKGGGEVSPGFGAELLACLREARRAALEEAASVSCWMCRDKIPLDKNGWHKPMGRGLGGPCSARDIRALSTTGTGG